MRRREFIAGLGSTAAWPAALQAQPANRVPTVGFLNSGSEADPEIRFEREAFEQALSKVGWSAGRVIIEYRAGGGNDASMRALAAELIAKHPQVIVSRGTQA
jgi:hypothetical protein